MKVVLFANTDWYLYNFRRDLALALQERGDDVILLSPQGEYVQRLQQLGFCWIEFPLSRQGMNPFKEIQSLWRLFNIYRREEPELVHHFTVKCVLYGSLTAHLAGVKRVVNSITGLGYLFLPGGALKNVLRIFVRAWYRLVMSGTRVIFENVEDQETFLRFGFIRPKDGYLISGAGVDVHRFIQTPEPQGTPIALLASRMLWDKGVGEFVEAARCLLVEGLDARFALAGRTDPGNPASISDAQIETWENESVIEWWGWIDDMPATLAKANIICLPSYREGLPTVLTEAAACGRAVIATDVPGCRDAVKENESGLLVKPRNSSLLADALRKLLSDPAVRIKMGASGRSLAEEKFASGKIISEILSVYDRVGKGSGVE